MIHKRVDPDKFPFKSEGVGVVDSVHKRVDPDKFPFKSEGVGVVDNDT